VEREQAGLARWDFRNRGCTHLRNQGPAGLWMSRPKTGGLGFGFCRFAEVDPISSSGPDEPPRQAGFGKNGAKRALALLMPGSENVSRPNRRSQDGISQRMVAPIFEQGPAGLV